MGISLDADDRWSTPPRVHRLWSGVLLPPIAWLLHLSLAYAMSAVVCTPPVMWPFFVLSAAALAVAIAGGGIAWRVKRDAAGEPEHAPTSRARGMFMAVCGIMLSAVFALAIVAQTIPMFVLEPCQF